jgi:hypothetical protein
MPLNNYSRLSIPRWSPSDPLDHSSNLRELERWGNDLPIFPVYAVHQYATTPWSSASVVSVPWADPGTGTSPLNIRFIKRFDWTDLLFHFDLTQYQTVGIGAIDIELALIPVADIGGTPLRYTLAQMPFEVLNQSKTISGTRTLAPTRYGADTYYCEVQARTTGGTMNVGLLNFGDFTVTEIVPSTDF